MGKMRTVFLQPITSNLGVLGIAEKDRITIPYQEFANKACKSALLKPENSAR